MNNKLLVFFLLLFHAMPLGAQKVFSEGAIIYNVKLESAEHKIFTGTYTFSFKEGQLRKDLKLNNGYQYIIILNSNANTVYSLQNRNNKKYAIELSITDIIKKQEKYNGFSVSGEINNIDKIAGCAAYKGIINYKDGTHTEIFYTKDWYPSHVTTFGRFPDARFIPLNFSYNDEDGVTMYFEVEKIEPGPVENGLFRIPSDYTIISNAEYKQIKVE